jgi:serine/threonine protein kinase
MSLPAGTQLGPYSIVEPLGAGGMGEVYRATDSRLKRQVAVKILPPDVAAPSDRLARFQREAEVLASLNHAHIAAIYGFEDADGVKALVMELVEGPTLADRIAQGPLPLDEALPIARQIAAALVAAHERGIIHRDLKPANIKVRNDGTVKVLDFGLAKLANTEPVSATVSAHAATLASPAVTTMGLILGTAAYMSPEQARGRDIDKRTDIWAFGAVLYEMLSGVRAFDGEDVTETMAAIVKSMPDWTALPADTPATVVGLLQKCLESRFFLSHAEFSPDGRFIAYVSNESGGREVYVLPYPGPGEKVRVSTETSNGRTEPVWASDRELLYRGFGTSGGVFSAAISSRSPFRVEPPRRVVELNTTEYDSTAPIRSWSVSPDGREFLASKFERRGQPITTRQVVLNWGEELRRAVPAR